MARFENLNVTTLNVGTISALPGLSDATDNITINRGLILTGVDTGLTTGGVIQAGTNAANITADVADMKFVSMYFDNGASSGDNRGVYVRLNLTGGGGGESLRAYTVLSVATGTAHGGHISLDLGTAGSITGLGVGVRSTLMFPNDVTLSGGTYSGGMSELYFWGDNSSTTDITGVTEHSIHRFVIDGDTTAKAKVQNAFSIPYAPSGSGTTNMLDTNQDSTASTDGLRILINGSAYYILLKSV